MTESSNGSQGLPRRVEVAVVGAGLAGLTAARRLHRAGLDVHLFEPHSDPGGRVRSIEVEGHRLDLGFQVLLTGYPAVQEELDLPALKLHRFEPGAIVVRDGQLYSLPDPFRSPGRWLEAILYPLATMGDKLRTRALRDRLRRVDPTALFAEPERMAAAWLRDQGFTERYLETFWIPFFSSVFLDPPLEVTSGLFQFVFRSIALGDIALPEEGIGAVPRQLLDGLPDASWHPRTHVASLILDGRAVRGIVARPLRGPLEEAGHEGGGATPSLGHRCSRIERADGRPQPGDGTEHETGNAGGPIEIAADVVILACGMEEAHRISSLDLPLLEPLGVSVVYFSTPEPVSDERRIYLNGGTADPGHHTVLLDNICPAYAPAGSHLVGVTVLGTPDAAGSDVAERVRRQMAIWFRDADVSRWRWLATCKVPMAQFRQPPGQLRRLPGPSTSIDRLFLAGDFTRHSSVQGALESGQRAADAVLDQRRV